MKVEQLVLAKDKLEELLIKVQDDVIDRLLIKHAIEHDGKS